MVLSRNGYSSENKEYKANALANGLSLSADINMKFSSVFVAAATFLTVLSAGPTGVLAAPKGSSKSHGYTGPNGEPYVPGKYFDRFFMLIGENMDIWDVEADPVFGNLWKEAPNGRLLGNYYGITHPSQVIYFVRLFT
jgi:hypothetical protein